jgi:hypothetical protein
VPQRVSERELIVGYDLLIRISCVVSLAQYPPKYEYNYFVANRHNQAAQGHKEIRNGDNTAGNYFVNLPKGESKTIIDYIADEWGFWPITR